MVLFFTFKIRPFATLVCIIKANYIARVQVDDNHSQQLWKFHREHYLKELDHHVFLQLLHTCMDEMPAHISQYIKNNRKVQYSTS